MSTVTVSDTPLEKIGLSLSGGGYRAASFHLGAMSYLNWLQFGGKPLLENVKMISTVSGGTITGAVYALQKQQGASFVEIYRLIMDKLHTVDLVKEGIKLLNPGAIWNNNFKRKNLINASASLYDQEFTRGATFESFTNMKSHLEAVVFNSTEFDHGVNFRFRNWGSGYFGNKFIQVPKAPAEQVKIADAIAASSCFTGGFEPILWPQDFRYEDADKFNAYCDNQPPLGLMDGGIYDNQGVESILNYKQRAVQQTPYFDLVIISDVASPYMEGFAPASEKQKKNILNITLNGAKKKIAGISRRINFTLAALSLFFLLLVVVFGVKNNIITGIFLTLGIISGGSLLAKIHFQKKLKGQLQNLLTWVGQHIPVFYRLKLSHLKIGEISVSSAEPLLLDRINSLLTLLGSVFLKVIRRLNYDKLYKNEKYKYRRMSNLIRELTEDDFTNKALRRQTEDVEDWRKQSIFYGTYQDVIGPKIQQVSEMAASFGTTLWFTEQEKLDEMLNKLVASGQCTMCYNMILYLESVIYDPASNFNCLLPSTKQEMLNLYNQCKDDWAVFKATPLFLLRELTDNRTNK